MVRAASHREVLKGILLFNRVPKPKKWLGHNLGAALALAGKALPFPIMLSPPCLEIIEHLDTYGRFRYLETPYHVHDRELLKLDKAVAELRPYCRVLDYTMQAGEKTVQMLPLLLEQIQRAKDDPSRRIALTGGVLEKILRKPTHPARPALVWKNMFFNGHKRKTVHWRSRVHFTNAPLSLHPELLEEVLKYVYLPSDVVHAYTQKQQQRAQSRPRKPSR